jgi:Lhr-like helicase
LREAEGAAAAAARKAAQDSDAYGEFRFYVPSTDGAEMRSRWDMQAAPPDILITNYSMLNIMLRRRRDDPLFKSTRRWLEAEGSVFTLVVDELHMYRGTQGSEVAFLLRNLFDRLGLLERPEKLRILSTSASLERERDRGFIEGFFAQPIDRFDIWAGETVSHGRSPGDLTSHVTQLANVSSLSTEDAGALSKDLRLEAALEAACDTDGRSVAISVDALGQALVPAETDPEVRQAAAYGALRAIGEGGGRVRGHLFIRTVLGVWACSNPDCVDGHRDERRNIGRLYEQPQYHCDSCGARVLELLYCETCGDVFLGGFYTHDVDEGSWQLFPDSPDLEGVPERARLGRDATTYLLYWPQRDRPEVPTIDTHWNREQYHFAFRKSVYEPFSGKAGNGGRGYTGWTFHIRARDGVSAEDVSLDKINPLPVICPSCGDDSERYKGGPRKRAVEDRQRTRSSLRRMGMGFEKANQVLGDELMRHLDTRRKLVLFSDSRMDAAKLAAGLETSHYRDLVRQLLFATVRDAAAASQQLDLALACIRGEDRSPEAVAARRWLRTQEPESSAIVEDFVRGDPQEHAEQELATRVLTRLRAPSSPLPALTSKVSGALLILGINPGGPGHSLATYPPNETPSKPWHTLFDWSFSPPRPLPSGQLSAPGAELQERVERACREEVVNSIFSGSGRDLESIGLAHTTADPTIQLDVPLGISDELFRHIVDGTLRVLGQRRRFVGMRNPETDPPGYLRRWLTAVADRNNVTPETLLEKLQSTLGAGLQDWLIDPGALWLSPAGDHEWRCSNCNRVHLHDAGGICTYCRSPLGDPEPRGDVGTNYYAWLASDGGKPFRLHCEELTGQTAREEAGRRQAAFQDIFLNNELEPVDTIDLLSVTTTMEAGVDIGGMFAIITARNPPMRFNYQQRVGRAGRRNDPLALALTVCRGRSHDDFYFDHPERITGDPPPAPYIDLSRPEILQRVLSAELLRQAFWCLEDDNPGLDLGRNVHGQFGTCGQWEDHRTAVEDWLAANGATVDGVLDSLLTVTKLVDERATLHNWISNDLLDEIEQLATAATAESDLSQTLAEGGLLPMFGFPTRVRYLFHDRPTGSKWPPRAVIDRDLEIAVSQFSPGAETPKDKAVHTAVGVGAWEYYGGRMHYHPQPLGPRESLLYCRACLHLEPLTDPVPAACPVCGEADPRFAPIDLAQPAGFITDWRPRDYDGQFEWTASATGGRLSPGRQVTTATIANLEAKVGVDWLYVVNDNGGSGFTLAPPLNRNINGLFSVDLKDDGARPLRIPELDIQSAETVALGSRYRTDSLLLAPIEIPDSLSLDPSPLSAGIAARAALYSAGFLLRESAARLLDVQGRELKVGLYVEPGVAAGTPRGWIFLADALENGAGYCTHLGQKASLEALLRSSEAYVAELGTPATHSCDSSCYDCLRGYENQPYHALLDWRLARDWLDLAQGRQLDVDRWVSIEESVSESFRKAFSGRRLDLGVAPQVIAVEGTTYVVSHPMESRDEDWLSPRLASAVAAAEDAGHERVEVVSSFDLLRRPGRVLAGL